MPRQVVQLGPYKSHPLTPCGAKSLNEPGIVRVHHAGIEVTPRLPTDRQCMGMHHTRFGAVRDALPAFKQPCGSQHVLAQDARRREATN